MLWEGPCQEWGWGLRWDDKALTVEFDYGIINIKSPELLEITFCLGTPFEDVAIVLKTLNSFQLEVLSDCLVIKSGEWDENGHQIHRYYKGSEPIDLHILDLEERYESELKWELECEKEQRNLQ